MPELPEVQTVVTTLRPSLMGKTIVGVDLARNDIVRSGQSDLSDRLLGRVIRSIDRRGKRIVFTLDDRNRFFIHLGMTGRLTISPAAEPRPTHTHLCLDIADDPKVPRQLRFRDPRRFGGIWWLGCEEDCGGTMGPEPLAIRPAQLRERLLRTTRAIKNALLDQRVVAGLGNIYVDESLFAAGIHPLSRADELSAEEVSRLNRSIKMILRRAIRHRGSTLRDYRDADGAAGAFQTLHRVYGRAGKPCPTCDTPIERIVLGGRSTHFCPVCQPAR